MPRTSPFLFLLLLAAALFSFSAPALADDEPEADLPSEAPGYTMDALTKLADIIQRTGIHQDKIPALNRPEYISVSDASLSMDDDDIVFIVEFPNNITRIYPRRIMVWHEVVNDVLPDITGNAPRAIPGEPQAAGESYTITYCPLTGSTTAFRSAAGKYPTTFGVSGNLLNGNTVLYDRVSHSLWCQLMAVCIEGPFKGKRLERIPIYWAKWKGAKARYAQTAQVMSRATGFKRSYGKDPYGTYHSKGSYYDDTRILFSLAYLDPRLPPKKRVLGIEEGDMYGAVVFDAVREARILSFTVGVTPMVAMYDEELDSVRVFSSALAGVDKPLTFTTLEGALVDEQTKSQWSPQGEATYGRLRGKKLTPVLAIDSMWFAWGAFHRGSRIFPYDEWQ